MFRQLLNKFKPKKSISKEGGLLFECEDVRKLKGDELANIKVACTNYVYDDVLTRLMTSNVNKIKNEAFRECFKILNEGKDDKALKKAGMVMLSATNKAKGLDILREDIKYFYVPKTKEEEFNANAHL